MKKASSNPITSKAPGGKINTSADSKGIVKKVSPNTCSCIVPNISLIKAINVKTKEGTDVFIPFGSGCFGKGTVVDKNKILVNIGSGLFMNKKIVESKTLLEKRMKDIERANEELDMHIERVTKQLNEMGAEIQQLTQQQNKP